MNYQIDVKEEFGYPDVCKDLHEKMSYMIDRYIECGYLVIPDNIKRPSFVVEWCKDSKHGDIYTNVAMIYSRYNSNKY